MGKFNANRLKVNLKLSNTRLGLQRKKMLAIIGNEKRTIAKLLAAGDEDQARVKVEHVIRDDTMCDAYEVLELYCQLLLTRIAAIAREKQPPEDMVEGICTLIFAAPRVKVKELKVVQTLFAEKYGRMFVATAIRNGDECVNERVAIKLSLAAPPEKLVVQYLNLIAEENNVDWMAPVPEDDDDDPFGSGGGGGGGGGGVDVDMAALEKEAELILEAERRAMKNELAQKQQQQHPPQQQQQQQPNVIVVPGRQQIIVVPHPSDQARYAQQQQQQHQQQYIVQPGHPQQQAGMPSVPLMLPEIPGGNGNSGGGGGGGPVLLPPPGMGQAPSNIQGLASLNDMPALPTVGGGVPGANGLPSLPAVPYSPTEIAPPPYSAVAGGGADASLQLPSVPTSDTVTTHDGATMILPDIPSVPAKGAAKKRTSTGGSSLPDFDDLTARFEALKRKK